MERTCMRRTTIALVCVMIAPLAFAQTKKTKVQRETAPQPVANTQTATNSTAGTIRKFEPGKTIMIDSTQGPLSFALAGDARIGDSAGNPLESPLNPGEPVRFH